MSAVNTGTVPVELHTYRVNALASINGGFAAGEEGDEPLEATSWVNFGSQNSSLGVGDQADIGFDISVPETAIAGQYVTALMAETAEPLPIPGTETLNQILGYAITIEIIVPGETINAFELGKPAFHEEAGLRIIRSRLRILEIIWYALRAL